MGKAKWFSESESDDIRIKSDRQARNRSANKPTEKQVVPHQPENGLSRRSASDAESMSARLQAAQVWVRLRRWWIAFRFQANRFTFGSFQEKIVLKLTILGMAMFAVTFIGKSPQPNTENDPKSFGIQPGTSLDVGHNESPKTNKSKNKNGGKKNEAAPLSAKHMNAALVNDYLARYGKIAVTEMEKFGVPASISLAQGLIESRAGTSKLAKSNNNHFGIKCFSRRCKKGHCSNHSDDTHKDFFRIFPKPWDCWREHSRMISTGRYAKLKKHGRDYRKWAYGLKSVGYATDKTYAEKLIGIIEAYDLQRFDR